MTNIASTRDHKIFHVESRGRALVVTPQGDSAGFGQADVKVERERVMALLADGEKPPNLIVDLGDANYFGSEMIGFINKMVMAVRERDGGHAVVNVSGDMQEGIAIMHLEELWNVSDEHTALREHAHENLLQMARRNAKAVGLVLAATTLVVIAAYVWSQVPPDRNVSDYETIAEIWNDFQERRRGTRGFEMASWKKKQLKRLETICTRLEKTASPRRPAQQHMMWACQDYLPKVLDPNLDQLNQEKAELFVAEMDEARKLIRQQYDVDLVKLYVDRTTAEGDDSPVPPTDPDTGTGDEQPSSDDTTGSDEQTSQPEADPDAPTPTDDAVSPDGTNPPDEGGESETPEPETNEKP